MLTFTYYSVRVRGSVFEFIFYITQKLCCCERRAACVTHAPHTCRNFDSLIPDAPELIHSYLEGEQDASCKRNAFMMLIHVDRVGGGERGNRGRTQMGEGGEWKGGVSK